jgi:hypothetical protein
MVSAAQRVIGHIGVVYLTFGASMKGSNGRTINTHRCKNPQDCVS